MSQSSGGGRHDRRHGAVRRIDGGHVVPPDGLTTGRRKHPRHELGRGDHEVGHVSSKRLGGPRGAQMRLDVGSTAPSNRVCDSADATRITSNVRKAAGRYTAADAGTARRKRLKRRRRGRRVEPRKRWKHAVERLGIVADEELEVAGIREPARGSSRQPGHPGIRRMQVGDAEPPDRCRFEIAGGCQGIRGR